MDNAGQSLKEKTVKGTVWSGIDNLAQLGVSFIVSIVLARLLSPGDYGLLGIIAIFTSICQAIVNGGFSAALIRLKAPTDDDYNTVFISNLIISLLLYFVIFVCSPAIASFFECQELVPLTRVSSLGMIIGALALVQQTRLTKRIDFRTQTQITIVSSVVSGIVGITMAFCGFGVWSLVTQSLLAQALRTIQLWILNKWMPSIHFSMKCFSSLFGFGWKLMLVDIINTLWKEIYQAVIGKFYTPATLGQYTRATQFSSLFSSNLTAVVQRVTYPVLSSIQDDKNRMLEAYRRIIKTTMFISAVSMFFLGAISKPLLYCLIGPQWHEAATYLPFICIFGALFPLHAINLNMLEVQGRSDIFLGLEIIKKTIAVGPILIGVFIGIIPMLLSSIIVSIFSFFLNSFFSGKMIGYSSWSQIKDVLPSFGVAIAVAVPVWGLNFLPVSNWIMLPMMVFFGGGLFFGICRVFKIKEFNEALELLMIFFKKTK